MPSLMSGLSRIRNLDRHHHNLLRGPQSRQRVQEQRPPLISDHLHLSFILYLLAVPTVPPIDILSNPSNHFQSKPHSETSTAWHGLIASRWSVYLVNASVTGWQWTGSDHKTRLMTNKWDQDSLATPKALSCCCQLISLVPFFPFAKTVHCMLIMYLHTVHQAAQCEPNRPHTGFVKHGEKVAISSAFSY